MRSGSSAARLVDPEDVEAMTALRRTIVDAAYAVNLAADRGDGLTATATCSRSTGCSAPTAADRSASPGGTGRSSDCSQSAPV